MLAEVSVCVCVYVAHICISLWSIFGASFEYSTRSVDLLVYMTVYTLSNGSGCSKDAQKRNGHSYI